MAENVQTDANQQPSLASLVGGIVNDAQQLIHQEMALARQDIQQSLERIKTAALSFGIGAGVGALSGVMFTLALVYLLNWAIPGLPLWGAFLIVAAALAVTAVVLILVAKNRMGQVVPQQTVQSVKENVQWIKNQT